MIVGEGEVHHRSGHDLVSSDDRSLDYIMHSQNSGLGRVQDGGAHHGPEHAAVGNSEGSSGHLFHGDFSLFSFVGQIN